MGAMGENYCDGDFVRFRAVRGKRGGLEWGPSATDKEPSR